MYWYIIICILMIYPLSIAHAGNLTGRKTKHIALLAAMSILWFFMAFRDVSVGVDTKHYAYVYSQFPDIPFSKVFTAVTYANERETWAFNFEPGYRLVNKLLSLFFPSTQAITIFNSTVIMVLWYFLIKRESPNFLLSVWLLLTLGIFQTEMNVTRNAIAILMVYNAFPYLRRGEFRKYLAVCLFAALFHAAALALIPVYPLARRLRLTPRLVVTLLGLSCAVGLAFPLIRPILNAMTPAGFEKYFQGNTERMGSLVVGILNGGVFALTYMLIPRKDAPQVFRKYRVGVVLLLINLCCFGLNIGLGYASRLAALYGPYLVILIPRMLTLIERGPRRREATAIIATLCGIQYILRMCINNIGGTLPYSFFW